MKYFVKFPNKTVEKKFEKILRKISLKQTKNEIMEAMVKLSENPCPYGVKSFKKLTPPLYFYQFTAEYRIRIGDYRVLYDVDMKRKTVWILHLRKRNERTYK